MSGWEWLQLLRPPQVNLVGGGRVTLGMDCCWARISAQFFGRKVTLCLESRRALTPPAAAVAIGRHCEWKSLKWREGRRPTQNCLAVQSEFWVEFYTS